MSSQLVASNDSDALRSAPNAQLLRSPDDSTAPPAADSGDKLQHIHDREVVENRKSSVQLVMLLIAVVFVIVAVVVAR